MKSVKLAAAAAFVVFACAWRFADDEVATSEQFLVKFGDQEATGRLRATGNGVVFELFENGVAEASRASLGLDQSGASSLTLSDGEGRARFHVATDKQGATSLGITDARGQTVWGVDVDDDGKVKFKTRAGYTPAEGG